jgi:hypothetical protein
MVGNLTCDPPNESFIEIKKVNFARVPRLNAVQRGVEQLVHIHVNHVFDLIVIDIQIEGWNGSDIALNMKATRRKNVVEPAQKGRLMRRQPDLLFSLAKCRFPTCFAGFKTATGKAKLTGMIAQMTRSFGVEKLLFRTIQHRDQYSRVPVLGLRRMKPWLVIRQSREACEMFPRRGVNQASLLFTLILYREA